jgi:hypothetical protein
MKVAGGHGGGCGAAGEPVDPARRVTLT